MKVFCDNTFEEYKAEAHQRWGNTAAYEEHKEKTKNYTKDKWSGLAADMDRIFGLFAKCLAEGRPYDSFEAQQLVKMLQCHITQNYYNCTKNILCGLGKMYAADEGFKNNIDKHGNGTAEFASHAIAHYCK